MITRCGHVFHKSCILEWFELKPLCPMCKTERKGSFERELRDVQCQLDSDVLDAVERRVARGESAPDAAPFARSIRDKIPLVAAAQLQADAAQRAEARALTTLRDLRAEDQRLAGRVLAKEKDAAAAMRELQEAGLSSLAGAAHETGPAKACVASGFAHGTMSREMVTSLGRQVGWRSSELRQLRAKVRKARVELDQLRAANATSNQGASEGKVEKSGSSLQGINPGVSGASQAAARAPASVIVTGLGRMGRPSLS
jgi:chromosome segregation ATPase